MAADISIANPNYNADLVRSLAPLIMEWLQEKMINGDQVTLPDAFIFRVSAQGRLDSLCDTATVTMTVNAKYNRSIQVDLVDFILSGTALSGDFTVRNASGDGKLAQVDEFKITAEYRDGNKWFPVAVENCTFNPSAPDTLADAELASYNFSCQMAEDVSAYPVRVTAEVHLFGRIKGSHSDGWYWERHTK